MVTVWWDPGTNQKSSPSPVSELKVLWGGATVFDQTINVQNILSDPGWSQFTVTGLTASSATTRLQFEGRQDPAILGLDDSDVEAPIPEPAYFGLSGSILLALALLASRRK